jgi:hypothetical protein
MAMRIFTVHQAPGAPAGDVVLVKEGFSWPALAFGPFWALWHGLWLWLAIWVAAAAVLAGMEELLPGAANVLGIVELGLAVLIAAEANDIRRRKLARQGYAEIGVVGGPDHDTAARRYVDLAAIGAH